MFLDDLLATNPAFCETVLRLHQVGDVDPGSFVVDIEGVRRNAQALAAAAASRGVELWLTAKHLGNEPTALLACLPHLPKFAAVNWPEAVMAHRLGYVIANVGHLVQVPVRRLPWLLELVRPEHVTVGNLDFLTEVSRAAEGLGTRQRVLLRVGRPTEDTTRAQGGGFEPEDVDAVLREAQALRGVEIVGVTLLGAIRYSSANHVYEMSENADRLHRARDVLARNGIQPLTSYAGNVGLASLPLLPRGERIVAEPGHALTGTTPDHQSPATGPRETTSLLFVTEVASTSGRMLLHGGGLYPYGLQRRCAIHVDQSGWTTADLAPMDPASIPYYIEAVGGNHRARIGDTALVALRPQFWTSHSPLVVVECRSGTTARITSHHSVSGFGYRNGK